MSTPSRDRAPDFQSNHHHHEPERIITCGSGTDHNQQTSTDNICDAPEVAGDYFEGCDYFGGVYEYINQMMLEDDHNMDHHIMSQQASALQATEKSFSDALKKPQGSGSVHRNKKNHRDDDHNGGEDERNNNRKQMSAAGYAEEEEDVAIEKYDKALLCNKMNPAFYDESPPVYSSQSEDEGKKQYRKSREPKRGRPKGTTNKNKNKNTPSAPQVEVVDLNTLLARCAESISTSNFPAAQKLMQQLRQHCSAHGDATQRTAHCFANALEARMFGTGSYLYTAFTSRRTPAADLLRSYQAYVAACPFLRMSNIFANKSIAKCAAGVHVKTLHIIDFGILHGYQWPCIIHGISQRPGGPPLLKITGIDFLQPPGFRPAERVEQTGRRLAAFARRFNVPFEYHSVAKKWDHVRLKDLKIERDEAVVVNCVYRLGHVPETGRDKVLTLFRRISPCLFVHGVVNGAYNAPFFTTRFREAVFHYSSLFDMVEATMPREDPDRLLHERDVLGRDVMNVVACEGMERVERPERYKQWQVRNVRAGYRQMALNKEFMREVKTKSRKDYRLLCGRRRRVHVARMEGPCYVCAFMLG